MNNSIAEIRSQIKQLIADQTNEETYQDIVPEGSEAGYLVELKLIGIDAKTIDGSAGLIPCDVDVLCYSFNSREESDQLADKLIGLLNNKTSSFFQRIRVTNILSLDFFESEGAFMVQLSFDFVVRANGF